MQLKHLEPYLNFNGNCEAAFKFYAELLGGKIEMMMTHAESPIADQVPPEWRKKIIHARLTFGDKVLLGSDAPPGRYETPKGFSVTLGVDKPAEVERIFKAFASHGTVQMPLAKTFFAESFGMVVDQFGTPWIVICDPAA
jgi:PhnB protein